MGFGCSTGTPTTTIVDPDPLKTKFVAANGTNPYGTTWEERRHLTIKESENLVYAIRGASGPNSYLQDAVLIDYTNNPFIKYDTDFPMVTIADAINHRTDISFRLDLGDPKIVYESYSAPKKGTLDPHGGLGTMVFHERLHWELVGRENAGEGATYGMEYYFARRLGVTRAIDIMTKGEWGGLIWSAQSAAYHRFSVWAFAMKWCYDIADGKMTMPPDMDKDRALQCARDFVVHGRPFPEWGSDRGKALAWARTQTNLVFGATWSEGDHMPGITLPPADTSAYRAECRARMSAVMSPAIPRRQQPIGGRPFQAPSPVFSRATHSAERR